ncbi:MAG: tetratricopeptide repeat protein [Bacteroidota bacterium]
MKKTILSLCLFWLPFFSFFGNAQPVSNSESYTFYLHVEPASEPSTIQDTLLGIIRLPHPDVLLPKDNILPLIEPYHVFSREADPLGTFKVIPIEEDYIWGYFSLNTAGKEYYDDYVIAGKALAEVEIKFPEHKTGNIFFAMCQNAVQFTDVYGEPFYDTWEILEYGSTEYDDYILKDMVKDIHFTAGEMRNSMESPMIESGRYKGMDLFTAMEFSSTKDVLSFLRYVKERPTKYRGNTWKVSETFATWLVSSSPTVSYDLLELLAGAYENDELFYSYIRDTDNSLLADWLNDWKEDGNWAMDKGDMMKARHIFEACAKTASILENPEEEAWAYYYIAQTFADDEAEMTRNYYYEALDLFHLADEPAGIIAAQNNLGSVLNDLGEFEAATKALTETLELELKYIPDPNEKTAVTLALTYRLLGNSYLGQKKYKKALSLYEEGLKYVNHNRALSLKRKSALYFQIAETYKEMGRDDDYAFYTELAVSTFRDYEAFTAETKKM